MAPEIPCDPRSVQTVCWEKLGEMHSDIRYLREKSNVRDAQFEKLEGKMSTRIDRLESRVTALERVRNITYGALTVIATILGYKLGG